MKIALGTLAIILSLFAGLHVISISMLTANSNVFLYSLVFSLAYFIAAVCTFKAAETAAYIFLLNGMLALNIIGNFESLLWACYSQLFFSSCLFIIVFVDKRKQKKMNKTAEN